METSYSLPFNTYDFFGYILPGTFLSMGLMYIFQEELKLSELITKYNDIEAFWAVFILLFVLAGVYFMGQLIGSISHLLYDRLVVRNIIGYPFQYILDLPSRPERSMRLAYLILLFFVLQLILAPTYYEFFCNYYDWNSVWKGILVWLLLCLGSFIVVFWLRLRLVCSIISRMDACGNFVREAKDDSIEKDKRLIKACEYGVKTFRWFFVLLRKISSTDTKVKDDIREKFIRRVHNEYKIDLEHDDKYNSDAYWIGYIGLLNADSKHVGKVENWMKLYGCLRNYSCSFLILAAVVAFLQWKSIINGAVDIPNTTILLIFLMVSFVLFIRYWIIYFGYYSKYIIRAYALSKEKVCVRDGDSEEV